MTTTMALGAVTQLWHTLVRDAEVRAHIELTENQESYLVFTLVRHCRDSLLSGRILSLELLDSLSATRDIRDERLRDVGDRCLLIAGLFPEQMRRRCVSEGYYADLGRIAYAELGTRLHSALASLYAELAETFRWLVDVLRAFRADVPLASLSPDRDAEAFDRQWTATVSIGQDGAHRRSLH